VRVREKKRVMRRTRLIRREANMVAGWSGVDGVEVGWRWFRG
jgi:hypothetical protein